MQAPRFISLTQALTNPESANDSTLSIASNRGSVNSEHSDTKIDETSDIKDRQSCDNFDKKYIRKNITANSPFPIVRSMSSREPTNSDIQLVKKTNLNSKVAKHNLEKEQTNYFVNSKQNVEGKKRESVVFLNKVLSKTSHEGKSNSYHYFSPQNYEFQPERSEVSKKMPVISKIVEMTESVPLTLASKASCSLMGNSEIINRKRQVYICVNFLKIGEIDTVKEQYSAKILIKAKWREPSLDNKPEPISFDWQNAWNPQLYIENTLNEPKEQLCRMINFNDIGHAFIQEKRRVSCTFIENLELLHFPFDVQDLSIIITSSLGTDEIRFVNDPEELHHVNKQSFIDEQEWYLYKRIESTPGELVNEYGDASICRPALYVQCKAARRPAYFIWNMFLVTFIITLLSMVTFSVDMRLVQNRLQLTFTLVLTTVAFKFVANQSIPKISYLTYLDRYLLANLIFLTLIGVWNGVASLLLKYTSHGYVDTIEKYIFILMTIVFFCIQIFFILLIYFGAYKLRRFLIIKDNEYIEQLKEQKFKKSARSSMTSKVIQMHEVKKKAFINFTS